MIEPSTHPEQPDANPPSNRQVGMKAALRRLFAFGLAMPAAAALSSSAAETGWSSLGAMSAPTWDGRALLFHGAQGTLAVTPISDDVIRVRFTTAQTFGRDHSYAVVNQDLGKPTIATDVGATNTILTTAALRVTIQHDPLRIRFANLAGEELDADDPDRGTALDGTAFRVAKRLSDDTHVYGLGEKTGRLDKRGWQLGGYNYVMWNSDTSSYDSSTDPLYVSVPFYLTVRHGVASGIFLDNTYRSSFDVGHERRDLLTFGAEGGELDYYFIHGPKPKQVIARYTALTGRMPLPPLWALGYNQCRWSYYPESRVRLLANTFREKRVPADVIWLDIHYLDEYKPFTWNTNRFPNPGKMLADLIAQGFHVVSIVDPHPKKEAGYKPYEEGLAGDHFVKNPDGSIFLGKSWPASAEENPGPSAFPDFSRPATREWWGGLYSDLLGLGIAGIWNDMDEPAVWDLPGGTMPLDVRHDNEGQPTDHREIHNVYGQLMSRSTFEGLSRLRPNERPFVLTRASFAGGQRYAAVWPGDNTADWSSLRQSISTLLGLGVSGFPFVGSDIGGFARATTGELYARWLQVGVFYPFMRAHTENSAPDKEPWSFGARFEDINRRTIELRYELLPYIYTVMQEAAETGVPAMRPLFLEYPDDERATGIDDEFLFGSDLLVAPVIWEEVTEREIYLPKGTWYDYWTGREYTGGRSLRVPVTLATLPLFVRGGGIIFRQPVVQFTGQMPGQPLRVLVAPAADSRSTLYEDDGKSLEYNRGSFLKREFHQARNDREITVEVAAPEGSYRPAARALVLETWLDRAPQSVSVGGDPLPRIESDALANSLRGWAYADGLVRIKESDRFEAVHFTIQR